MNLKYIYFEVGVISVYCRLTSLSEKLVVDWGFKGTRKSFLKDLSTQFLQQLLIFRPSNFAHAQLDSRNLDFQSFKNVFLVASLLAKAFQLPH